MRPRTSVLSINFFVRALLKRLPCEHPWKLAANAYGVFTFSHVYIIKTVFDVLDYVYHCNLKV